MSALTSRTKRIVWISVAAVLTVLLVVAALIAVPILTHRSGGSSGQVHTDDYVSRVSAHGDDDRTRTLSVTADNGDAIHPDQLRPGQRVTVTGTGYDPGIGVYVSFCRLPASPTERPSPCLGKIPASEEAAADAGDELLSSAWVTNNWAWRAFATHGYEDDGFAVTLIVPEPAGNGVDCRTERCGIVTRADHTASGDRVQDVAIPVAWEGQRPPAAPGDATEDE